VCLSIPGKISKISKTGYQVDYGSKKIDIANSLVNGLKLGDWVMVQNKFIVNKWNSVEASLFFEGLIPEEERR